MNNSRLLKLVEQDSTPESADNPWLGVHSYVMALADDNRTGGHLGEPINQRFLLGNELQFTLREFRIKDSSRFILKLTRGRGSYLSIFKPELPFKLVFLVDSDEDYISATMTITEHGVSVTALAEGEDEDKDLNLKNDTNATLEFENIVRMVIFDGIKNK